MLDNTITVFIVIGSVFFLFTCWAVIDLAVKDFGGIEKKALWGFIALLPFIGFIIYFIFGRKKGVKRHEF